MKIKDIKPRLLALVVGTDPDNLVSDSISILNRNGIKNLHCGDIYAALTKVIKFADYDILVISRSSTFNTEDRRFFDIVSKYSCICCCFEDTRSVGRYVQSLTSIPTVGFVVNKIIEIEEIVVSILNGDIMFKPLKDKNPLPSSFMKDDFFTTTEEIEALLGRNN